MKKSKFLQNKHFERREWRKTQGKQVELYIYLEVISDNKHHLDLFHKYEVVRGTRQMKYIKNENKARATEHFTTFLLFVVLTAILLGPIDSAKALTEEEKVAQSSYDSILFGMIDAKNPKTQTQVARYNEDFSEKITGLCNVSSSVTLLNRALAYHYLSGSFTPTLVLKGCGCTNIKNSGNKYYYKGDTDNWITGRTYTLNGNSFKISAIYASSIKNATTKANFYEYIAGLLHKHPEGVAIRNTKANHVCVIYKYTYSDGKYTLYVKDPVNNYSGKLESSSCYLWNNSGKDIYTNVEFIAYISYSSVSDHMQVISVNISNEHSPEGTIEKGKGFPLRGLITASENISSVVATIYDRSTGVKAAELPENPVTVNPNNKNELDIERSDINTKLQFEYLKDNNYQYEVIVTTVSGYTQRIINRYFTVGKGPTVNISVSGECIPTGNMPTGLGFPLRGKITSSETITSVKGTIFDLKTGNPSTAFSPNPITVNCNSTTFDIESSDINKKMLFGKLPAGGYRYQVDVTTFSGYTETVLISEFTMGNVLIERLTTIGETNITVPYGTSADCLDVEIYPEHALNQTLKWSSTNPDVATVEGFIDDGGCQRAYVEYHSPGETTIKCETTDGSNKYVTWTIKVVCEHSSSHWETVGNEERRICDECTTVLETRPVEQPTPFTVTPAFIGVEDGNTVNVGDWVSFELRLINGTPPYRIAITAPYFVSYQTVTTCPEDSNQTSFQFSVQRDSDDIVISYSVTDSSVEPKTVNGTATLHNITVVCTHPSSHWETVENEENRICDNCGAVLEQRPINPPQPGDKASLTASSTTMEKDGSFILDIGILNNPGIGFIVIEPGFAAQGISIESYEAIGPENTGISITVGSNIVLVTDKGINQDGKFLRLNLKASVAEDKEITLKCTSCFTVDEDPVTVDSVKCTVKVQKRIPGDATDDGIVDGRDVLRLMKYFAGQNVTFNESNADVTGDGIVDGRDVLRLMKYFAGQNVELK